MVIQDGGKFKTVKHRTRMKIRGSAVSLSFIFSHPPENEKKKVKADKVLAVIGLR